MANIISVSALNKYVKSILESDENLIDLAVQGEISNFTKHYKTGHCYFTIKDASSGVKAVMFKGSASRLAFKPENGMKVIARCRVSLYERDGSFQIYVEDLFPDGVGAAQMAFEQLKQRLLSEGLFEGEYKKPLPPYPRTIGLVTSKTGAALQDILKVAARRYPVANFLLAPVTVQGQAAAPEIANAIELLDSSELVEVIIVARGGGSAEDLWVFNDERIARAAFAAKAPIVSAIGHEIDVTILDFVADLRAPTPSAAAEMVLPDLTQTIAQTWNIYANITNIMQLRTDSCYNRLQDLSQDSRLLELQQYPQNMQQELQALAQTITQKTEEKANNSSTRFRASAKLAASLNPYSVLARGYTVTRQNEQVLSSIEDISSDAPLCVSLKNGDIICSVQEIIKTSNLSDI